MITAEEARALMPNIEGVLNKIEKQIRGNASQGLTKLIYRLTRDEAKLDKRHLLKKVLIELGYSLSEDGANLTISWRKL